MASFLDNLLTELQNKLDEIKFNSTESETTISSSTELGKISKEIQDIKKNIIDYYKGDFAAQEVKIIDTLIQLIQQSMYISILTKDITEYKSISEFLTILFGEDSKLNNLLRELENTIRLYYNITDLNEKKLLAGNIERIILELLKYLKFFVEKYNLIPDNIVFTTDANGNTKLKISENGQARSFSAEDSFKFYAYMGETDRKGYVGQKSQVFAYFPLKSDNTRDGDTFRFSAPLLNMSNIEFKHDPAAIFTLFGVGRFNKYDYTASYIVENDGSDEENTDEYVEAKSLIRFGNLLSKDDIDFSALKQPFRIKVDQNSDWANGTITKKGIFKINNFKVQLLFDDEEITTEIGNYPIDRKMSDTANLFMDIEDINSGVIYRYVAEDLMYDESLTNQKHTEDITDTASYYTGQGKIVNTNDTANEMSSVSEFGTTKDIVLKIKPNETPNDFSIMLYLDPESTTNASIYEDSGNDALVYLPVLASNIYIESIALDTTLHVSSPKMAVLTDLLELTNLLSDLDNLDVVKYSNILNNFNNSKNELVSSLLGLLEDINSVANTAVLIKTIYDNIDENYSEDYIEDITTNFANIQSTLSTYLTSGTEYETSELYDGTIYRKIYADIEKSIETIVDMTEGTVESLKFIRNYSTLFSTIFGCEKNEINLVSTLAAFYDTLTLNSQTLTAASTGGMALKKFTLLYAYPDWIELYKLIDNGNSEFYYISTLDLQLLYAITQTYKYLINKNNPCGDMFRKLSIDILLNTLEAGLTNETLVKIFKPEIVKAVENKISIQQYLDCSFDELNDYTINPYFIELIPALQEFNKIDISKVLNDYASDGYDRHVLPLLYKGLLELGLDQINERVNKFNDFAHNGQILNIREAILVGAFDSLMGKLSKTDYGDVFKLSKTDYKTYGQYKEYLDKYFDYYKLYADINNPFDLFKVDQTTTEKSITVGDHIISIDPTRVANYTVIGAAFEQIGSFLQVTLPLLLDYKVGQAKDVIIRLPTEKIPDSGKTQKPSVKQTLLRDKKINKISTFRQVRQVAKDVNVVEDVERAILWK